MNPQYQIRRTGPDPVEWSLWEWTEGRFRGHWKCVLTADNKADCLMFMKKKVPRHVDLVEDYDVNGKEIIYGW